MKSFIIWLSAIVFITSVIPVKAEEVCVTSKIFMEALDTNTKQGPSLIDNDAAALSAYTNFPYAENVKEFDVFSNADTGVTYIVPLNKNGCTFAKDGSQGEDVAHSLVFRGQTEAVAQLIAKVTGRGA